MQQYRYTFTEIESCVMCGSPSSQNYILGQRLNKSQGYKPKSKTGITTTVQKCSNCSLIYSNPQPVPYDIQDHYGIPPENYWTEKYFTVDKNYFSYQIGIAKKLINFQPGMKALDVGAGIGKCMVALNRSEFDAYGLEPSTTFRDKALEKMNLDSERLKLGMLEEMDYEENTFDFITFGAVLEHLYNPAYCIERTMKWLKPGGVIQIEVPSSNWLIPKFFNLYFKLIGTNYTTNLSPMHEPFHLFEFTLKSFQELAKKLNYEIAFNEIQVCSIYHIPSFLHPLLRWYMKKTGTGMQLTVFLRKK
jgi:ubiquinone/menaquinone biosynthesis C-methylase UbiE